MGQLVQVAEYCAQGFDAFDRCLIYRVSVSDLLISLSLCLLWKLSLVLVRAQAGTL